MSKIQDVAIVSTLRIKLGVLSVLLMGIAAVTAAQLSDEKINFESFETQYELSQKSLNEKSLGLKDLQALEKKLAELKPKLSTLISSQEILAQKTKTQLESLGVVTANESDELQSARKSLLQEHAEYSQNAAKLKLLVLKGDDQLEYINKVQAKNLRIKLLDREPNIVELIILVWNDENNTLVSFTRLGFKHTGIEHISIAELSIYLFLLGLAIYTANAVKRRTVIWAAGKTWDDEITSRFMQNFLFTTARYIPRFILVLTLTIFSIIEFQSIDPVPVIANFCYGLSLLVPAIYLSSLFFNPKHPARLFLEISQQNAKAIAKRLKLLFLIGFFGYIIYSMLRVNSISDHYVTLARDMFATTSILLFIGVINYAKQLPVFDKSRWLQRTIILVLFVIMVIELLGYRNLAFLMFRIIALSMIAYGVFLLLHQLQNEFFSALDQGKRSWHRPLRTALGLMPGQHIPGLTGIRLIAGFMLWTGFVFVVLNIFGLTDQVILTIRTFLLDGFTLGNLVVNPARIFLAAAVFILLFTLSNWIKVRLDTKWLTGFKVERGVREALITVTGYVGVIIALLIALSIAGVTFTSFAIIAGALSVGIGFGLQNIVNNFVSGLILLFERPIRKGDWIVVGSTEGYVKKISIRSTQLQTFDRADVIIPNSDLISNQVINWMLHDKTGRIRIPVGVAYGSDLEKVRHVLLSVANNNNNVIKNDDNYKMRVLFMEFGDSALNMELRCHIKNIDEKFQIISDLNFAIDKIFRENNIEIPFPQRDVHFINSQNPQG